MDTPFGARPVVLVGFMGAGKSTVGPLVAARLGRVFVDSDDVITERVGHSPREIFARQGEATFRAREHAVIAELLAPGGDTHGDARVVALGGGAVEDARTRAVLRRARVVYLEVSHAEVLARVGGDPGRPMLQRPGLDALHHARTATYREVADVTIATDGLAPHDVAERVLAALVDGDAGVSRADVVQ